MFIHFSYKSSLSTDFNSKDHFVDFVEIDRCFISSCCFVVITNCSVSRSHTTATALSQYSGW